MQYISSDALSLPESLSSMTFSEPAIVEPWLARLPTQSLALVHRWIEALNGYDYGEKSPLTYLDLDRVGATHHTFSLDGKEYPAITITSSELSQRRREFMALQTPYRAIRTLDSYPGVLAPEGCMLCENILQAYDAESGDEPPRNNLILRFHDCAVLPNRYPAELLHSLIVPANHDDFSERVVPAPADSNPGERLYSPEPNRTRGAIISPRFLETVLEVCDTFHWAAVRNHVLDGMSIPAHDHFQTFPMGAHHLETLEALFPGLPDGTMLKVLVPDTTPFDTLFVVSRDRRMLVDYVAPILEKMERADEVFTLWYHDGRIAISPRVASSQIDKRLSVGGGIPLHQFDPSNDRTMEDIFRFVPLAGRFDWDRYL